MRCGLPMYAEISIHAPREGSDARLNGLILRDPTISIHAPREGSDPAAHPQQLAIQISIHAPREGSDGATWACSMEAE